MLPPTIGVTAATIKMQHTHNEHNETVDRQKIRYRNHENIGKQTYDGGCFDEDANLTGGGAVSSTLEHDAVCCLSLLKDSFVCKKKQRNIPMFF